MILLGFVFLGLAIVGYILPVMPGTVFLILSAACFGKSSPRMENYLLQHPKFGPTLRGWRHNGSISRKHKTIAVSMITLSSIVTIWRGHLPWWGYALLGVVAIPSAWFILTRPDRIDSENSAS